MIWNPGTSSSVNLRIRVASFLKDRSLMKQLNDQPCRRKVLTAKLVSGTARLDADHADGPLFVADPCKYPVTVTIEHDRVIFRCKLEFDFTSIDMAERAVGPTQPALVSDHAAHFFPGNAQLGRRELPADLLLSLWPKERCGPR